MTRELYIIMTHDLEDVTFYGTEDKDLFDKADSAEDLQDWLWNGNNIEELEELGEDITGITVQGFTSGLSY